MELTCHIPPMTKRETIEKLNAVLENIIPVDDVDNIFDYEHSNKSLQTFYSIGELAISFEEELDTLEVIKKSDFFFQTSNRTIVYNHLRVLRSVKPAYYEVVAPYRNK
ncbi:hypothetical protein [Listeria booriae]|uniref:Uncharacterized protein n=1 Tax=Listeria booriae TaxID=1552123 RepID=A0A7X0XBU8_9LIST|nr:hypothetical protein [Listeria booriae]MBC1491017.1 hypothetical protein [Listeria booriae]MBC1491068.1 hypothetical protein [Listeria booriae]MBC2258823.1 hypothetical protein [Listeria booriae]MBC2292998.1 hypothetical protein [Listeria booriae]MBC6151099.1 hypothetical protein [Listeria booriae]